MKLTELLKVLSDPTRLRIMSLLALRGPELCVCDLVAILKVPQSTVSRQLMPLRHLGVVNARREGQWVHYSLAGSTTRAHGALLRCLADEFGGEPQLAADVAALDKLRARKALAAQGACCRARHGTRSQPPGRTGRT
jgi:ArsR family transcriptional regulator